MLEKLGKYEIRLQIGRGAMGIVYEGFDPAIGRRVAIKTLRTEMFEQSQLPEVLVRFKREAQSAGRLSHPHIVTIYEYGEQDRTPYIVMEYINGKELGHELDRGVRFPLDDVARLMTQLLGALGHAHEHGVVHRDLKPANMFVLDDGSLKVVDFGIARVESSNLTETGAMLGTPAYMSPEQIMAMPVDFRSDLFSAGVILYQLLTGDKPFSGSLTSIMQKVLKQEPLAPSEVNPILSSAWDAVVARAMAKKPEARYASARQFSEAIKLAREADRHNDEEIRRKTAEAAEHALREAEERSKEQATRREEQARREIERREREDSAPDKAKTIARREPEETVVARTQQKLRTRSSLIAAIAVGLVIGIAGVLFYHRQEASRRNGDIEAERAKEEQTRQQIERQKKASDDQVARAAQGDEEARREAERIAQSQADERAKREAEEKVKSDTLKRQQEKIQKAEQVAKAATVQKSRLEAEANARAEQARKEAEEIAKKEANAKAAADAAEKARSEQAKVDATKKAAADSTAARKATAGRGDGYDGQWSGAYRCGAYIGPGVGGKPVFTNPVSMTIKNGKATIERVTSYSSLRMSGSIAKDGNLTLTGEGSDNASPSAWWIRFEGKFTDAGYEAKGSIGARGETWRECQIFLSN